MPEPTTAGTDVVDDVRHCLDGVEDRPLVEHVAAYDRAHRLLQDALARLDEG